MIGLDISLCVRVWERVCVRESVCTDMRAWKCVESGQESKRFERLQDEIVSGDEIGSKIPQEREIRTTLHILDG